MDQPQELFPADRQKAAALQTKRWSTELSAILEGMKMGTGQVSVADLVSKVMEDPGSGMTTVTSHPSRERSLAITKLEEAILWLSADLDNL